MLTGLELTFMGVTPSNSGLFSTPGFLISPVGKRGMGAKKNGRREKGNRKGRDGRKEGWEGGRKAEGIKKDRRTERKKEFRGKGGKKKVFCWL